MPVAPHEHALTEAKSLFKRLKGAGEHSVVHGNVRVDALGRKWNPSLHPRDARGRFIETGGIARTWNGKIGRVLKALGGNPAKVLLQFKDGKRGTEYANRLTMIRRPDGSLPTSNQHRVIAEDQAREKHPHRGNGLDVEDFGHHNDRDGDGIPDSIDPDPGTPADQPHQFAAVKDVLDHWRTGDLGEPVDGSDSRFHQDTLKQLADNLKSTQLSPNGTFLVGRYDDTNRWFVYHSGTGSMVAGSPESQIRTKKEALALARALEDMDVHGERFDWDSPGLADRIQRDQNGVADGLRDALERAKADVAAQPKTRKAPVRPNATNPDGTPKEPTPAAPEVPAVPEGAAPKAPDLPSAPEDPRDAGYQDAERWWQVQQTFHADPRRARQQADTWDRIAHDSDNAGLSNAAERRSAAAQRLRELAGDQPAPQTTPEPHRGTENGAQAAPEGASRGGDVVRGDRGRPHEADAAPRVDPDDTHPAEGAGRGEGDGGEGVRRGPARQQDTAPEAGGDAGGGAPADGERQAAARGRGDQGVPASGSSDGSDGSGQDRGPAGGVPARETDAVEPLTRRFPDAARFKPQSQDDLAPHTVKQKAQANIEVLRTLKKLREEDRPATPEEQKVLARWAGWGSLSEPMWGSNENHAKTYAKERAALAELMTPEEIAAARKNTLNAHYTDADMVKETWQALEDLGFDGGTVLEPGSGSGNFMGFAPPDAHMVGVELDPITADISRYLYPDARVVQEGIEDFNVPDGTFDAAIGNVPFSSYRPYDRVYNPSRTHNLHNLSIIKSLAKLRQGGVAALITSSWTMDGQDRAAREAMYDKADLIGAVRLPSGVHERAAGSKVLTDLLIFRRRKDGEPKGDKTWLSATHQIGEAVDKDGVTRPLTVNNYWEQHPEDVLGRMGKASDLGVSGLRTDQEIVVKGPDGNVGPALKRALDSMTRRADARGLTYSPPDGTDDRMDIGELLQITGQGDAAEGSLSFTAGGFKAMRGGRPVDVKVPQKDHAKMKRLLELRDVASELLTLERSTEEGDDTRADALREKLNKLYDAYIAKNKSTEHPQGGAPINDGVWKSSPSDAKLDEPRTGVLTEDLEPGNIIDWHGANAKGKQRTAVVTGIDDNYQVTVDVIGETGAARAQTLDPDARQRWTIRKQRTTNWYRKRQLPGAFETDPLSGVVINLESYDPETNTASKGALLKGRTLAAQVAPADVSDPAVALSMVLDRDGSFDLPRIAQIMGVDEATAKQRLTGHVFTDPASGRMVSREEYLSGDVRKKLREVEAAVLDNPELQANVDALNEVLPEWHGSDRIEAKLGASWLSGDLVTQFARELLDDPKVKVTRDHGSNWTISDKSRGNSDTLVGTTWGTDSRSAYDLLDSLLHQRKIRVTSADKDGKSVFNKEATDAANAKAKELADRFAEWLFEDPQRADDVMQDYNARFNSLVKRAYSDAEFRPDGMSETFDLYPHQAQAVRRILNEPAVLIAHEVGAGKTLEMASAAMEMKRRGLANKPMLVVPNHMKEQWQREFLTAFPQARLLAVSGDDLKTPEARRDYLAKIATGDWDAVITTHSTFGSIKMTKDAQRRYIDKQLASARAVLDAQRAREAAKGEKDSKKVKDLEKRLADREAKLKEKLDKQSESGVTFEQLGVDYLMVDEAHEFKNLDRVSTTDEGIDGSDMASDLDMKLDYLRGTNQSGRFATFATATPVSNSFGETHTVLKYLRPDLLEDAGIEDFDTFLANFARMESKYEQSADGASFVEKYRIRSFTNAVGLFRMWQQVADVLTGEDLDLDVPDVDGGRPEQVIVPGSEWLKNYTQSVLKSRAEAAKKNRRKKGADNILVINSDGSAAALDPRMVGGPELPEGSKLDRAADEIAAIAAETADNVYTDPVTKEPHPRKGGFQLAFLDMGTPGSQRRYQEKLAKYEEDIAKWEADGNDPEAPDAPAPPVGDSAGFEAYEELKKKLIARGIPPEKIAFMHDAKGDDGKKAKLFARARSGELSVLVGSTALMGVGTNVQDRVVALHHLDVPYRPSDLRQRDGRAVRQKNQNSKVRVLQYATEGSLDSRKWEIQARKDRFIGQLMKGDLSVDAFDELSPTVFSAEEMAAHSSGNTVLLQQIENTADLQKVKNAKRAFAQAKENARKTVEGSRRIEHDLTRQIAALDEAVPKVQRADDGELGQHTMSIGDGSEHFEKRLDANAALRDMLQQAFAKRRGMADGEEVPLGTFGGFQAVAQAKWNKGLEASQVVVSFPDLPDSWFAVTSDAMRSIDVVARLDNLLSGLERQRDNAKTRLPEVRRNRANAEAQLGKQFKDEGRLQALEARAQRLEALQGWYAHGDKSEKPPADLTRDAPEVEAFIGRSGAVGGEEKEPRPPASSMANITEDGAVIPRATSHLARKRAKELADAAAGKGKRERGKNTGPRNPDAGKRIGQPQTRPFGRDGVQVFEVVAGSQEGTTRDRVLFNVQKDGRQWGAFRAGAQEADQRFASQDEARDWALAEAHKLNTPAERQPHVKPGSVPETDGTPREKTPKGEGTPKPKETPPSEAGHVTVDRSEVEQRQEEIGGEPLPEPTPEPTPEPEQTVEDETEGVPVAEQPDVEEPHVTVDQDEIAARQAEIGGEAPSTSSEVRPDGNVQDRIDSGERDLTTDDHFLQAQEEPAPKKPAAGEPGEGQDAMFSMVREKPREKPGQAKPTGNMEEGLLAPENVPDESVDSPNPQGLRLEHPSGGATRGSQPGEPENPMPAEGKPTAPAQAPESTERAPYDDLGPTGLVSQPTGPYQGAWEPQKYRATPTAASEVQYALENASDDGEDPGMSLGKGNTVTVTDPHAARHALDGLYQVALSEAGGSEYTAAERRKYAAKRDGLRKLMDSIHEDQKRLHEESQAQPTPTTGTPQVVSEGELDRIASQPGAITVYRGVNSTDGANATRRGALGGGMYGHAVYTSRDIGTAQGYAGERGKDGGEGRIMRSVVSPDARLIKEDAIPEKVRSGRSGDLEKWVRDRGYDGLDTGKWVLVYNPAKLTHQDRDYTVPESVAIDRAQSGYVLPESHEEHRGLYERFGGKFGPDGAEKLQGTPPADPADRVEVDPEQVRADLAEIGAAAPDEPAVPDEPDVQNADAPEAEPEQAAPPLADQGDLTDSLTYTNADHGLVLDGAGTYPNKDTIRDAGFRWTEVPGGGRDRNGRPVRKWTATGTPEQRAAALARLADALGVSRDGGEPEEKYPPTGQQQGVIDAVKSGKDVVVRALAGTGKTSTLEMIARRLHKDEPGKRIAYVAFNKSIQVEASQRMPGNVESRTGDSIAFQAMTEKLKDKFSRQKKANFNSADRPFRRLDEVAKHLEIEPLRNSDGERIDADEVAGAALRTVENYAISADDQLDARHVPEAYRDVWGDVLLHARDAWKDLQDPNGRLRLTNSHITKMWALTKPDLSKQGSGLKRTADVIFFDEAQDINPVMAKVIADQHIQKVYVGDSNQAIYGFRGAQDELDRVQAEHDLPLTKSWRFGPEVADAGNRFLQLLSAPHRVEGGGGPSTVHPADTMTDPDAVLVRSNAGAIEEILTAQRAGRLVGVPKGTKADLQKLAYTARWLKGDGPVPQQVHDDLAAFRTWAEVKKAAEKGDDPKVTMLARIVDANGWEAIEALTEELIEAGDGDDRKPDVVVTTAHKAKGLEWDRVKIGPDFRAPKTDPKTGAVEMPSDEENRLAYVAVTRARKELDPGSLAWVYEHTDDNGGTPGEDHVPAAPEAEAPEAPAVEAPQPEAPQVVEAPAAEAPEAPAAPKPKVEKPRKGDEPTFHESYGTVSKDQLRAYKKHNVSPADHDDLVEHYGEDNHRAITDAVKDPKNQSEGGGFSSYRWRQNLDEVAAAAPEAPPVRDPDVTPNVPEAAAPEPPPAPVEAPRVPTEGERLAALPPEDAAGEDWDRAKHVADTGRFKGGSPVTDDTAQVMREFIERNPDRDEYTRRQAAGRDKVLDGATGPKVDMAGGNVRPGDRLWTSDGKHKKPYWQEVLDVQPDEDGTGHHITLRRKDGVEYRRDVRKNQSVIVDGEKAKRDNVTVDPDEIRQRQEEIGGEAPQEHTPEAPEAPENRDEDRAEPEPTPEPSPEPEAPTGPQHVEPGDRRKVPADAEMVDAEDLTVGDHVYGKRHDGTYGTLEVESVRHEPKHNLVIGRDENGQRTTMRMRAQDAAPRTHHAGGEPALDRDVPDTGEAGAVNPADLHVGDVYEGRLKTGHEFRDKATRQLRVLGEPRKQGFAHDVHVEDTRTGERGIASLPSNRPVHAIERAEHHDEDRRDEDRNEPAPAAPSREAREGNAPGEPDLHVPNGSINPNRPDGRDENSDSEGDREDGGRRRRVLPSVRKLNNRPGPNHRNVPGGGPDGVPGGGLPHPHLPDVGGHGRGKKPGSATGRGRGAGADGGGRAAGDVPTRHLPEHEPSASQPSVDEPTTQPAAGGAGPDVNAEGLGVTGGAAEVVSTATPDAPGDQEIVPHWTRDQLDESTWDDLADIVGEVGPEHFDALAAYMDDRQAAEDRWAGSLRSGPDTTPGAGVSAGQGGSDIPGNAFAGDAAPSEGAADVSGNRTITDATPEGVPVNGDAAEGARPSIGEAYQQGGYASTSKGWPKKTRKQLGAEVEDLNREILDRIARGNPNPQTNIQDAGGLLELIPPRTASDLLRGRQIPLRAFLDKNAPTVDGRRKVNPKLSEEDTLHFFDLQPGELEAAARQNGRWSLKDAVHYDRYVAAYDASRNPDLVDQAHLLDGEAPGTGQAAAGAAEVGERVGSVVTPAVDVLTPSVAAAAPADTAAGENVPELARVTAARADRFDQAGPDGWADMPVDRLRSGDLIKGGRGKRLRQVVDSRPGDGGTDVLVRDGDNVTAEHYPHSDGDAPTVQASSSVGRALDFAVPHAAAPREGRRVGAGGRFVPADATRVDIPGAGPSRGQMIDLAAASGTGVSVQVDTPAGPVVGRLTNGDVRDGLTIATPDGHRTVAPGDIRGVRVLSGALDVRGDTPVPVADLPPGSRAAVQSRFAGQGRRDVVGQLVRDADGDHVLTASGNLWPISGDAQVRPVFRYAGAGQDQADGTAPGVWTRTPSGAVVASAPGEWSAAIVPQGSDGVAWRLSGAVGTAAGRAGSVEGAKAELGRRLAAAADDRKVRVLPRDDVSAQRETREAPTPVMGTGAEWAPVTDLVIGDRARVDGWSATGQRQSYAGHVIGVTPVLADRQDGRFEPMLAVTLGEDQAGLTGWRGTVVAPIDSLAARVPTGSDGADELPTGTALDVLAGRLPEQIPTDGGGNALFPGSIVTEIGGEGRTGIVTQARRADVSVQWGDGRETDATGAALRVDHAGPARPAGWTRAGQRVQPGMVIEFGGRDTRNHAGATVRAGARQGTVESVDGDTALVSTPDGLRPVNVTGVRVVGRAAPDRPDQAPDAPARAHVEEQPTSDLEPGDVVLLSDDTGSPAPAVVEDVTPAGDALVVSYRDGRDGSPGQVEVDRDDAVPVAVGDAGDPVPLDTTDPLEQPSVVVDPGQLSPPDGPTGQPSLLPAARDAVVGLGYDVDGVSEPDVATAAARLRAGQPLTAGEGAALAAAVRAAAGADGADAAHARVLARAAQALDAAADHAAGKDIAAGPAPDLGAGKAAPATPRDLAPGDMVAIPKPDGMPVGRVTRTYPVLGGRMWHVDYDQNGERRSELLSADRQVWRLPDVAEPTATGEPPARLFPDDAPAGTAPTAQEQAADAVAVNAAQAALGSGSVNEMRDRVAQALTAGGIDDVAKGADPQTRDAIRASALRTINEADPLPGEAPENTAARVAGMLLSVPAVVRDARRAQEAADAAQAKRAATVQRVTPVPAAAGITRDARTRAVDGTVDEMVNAVLKAAGVKAGQVTPGTLAQLVQLADEIVASGQQAAAREILAEVTPPPGAATRLMAAFKAVRARLVAALRSALRDGGPVRDALRVFSATVRRDALGWEETGALQGLVDRLGGASGDGGRAFLPGEPAGFHPRVDHWRGLLPGPGLLARAEVRGRWYGALRRSDLPGEVRAEDGTRIVLDRAVDGGPGHTALAHVDALRGLGRAVSDEVTARAAAALPDLGPDPRAAVRDAQARVEEAQRRFLDAAAAGDKAASQVRAELDQLRAESEQVQRRVSTQVARDAARVLAEIRAMGGDVAVHGDPDGVDAARWAAQHLPTDWLAAVADRALAVHPGERGWYDGEATRAALARLDELTDGAGPLGRSALHELWHHIEEAIADVRAAEWAYHWHRTSTGEVGARRRDGRHAARSLAEVLPGRGHSRTEMTREDGFTDPYVGREFTDQEKWEIGAMAFESLFGGSPYLDDDLQDWLLGVLAHVGGRG